MPDVNKFTSAQLPANIQDPVQLKMFLQKLINDIDVAFGDRDNNPFLTEAATSEEVIASSLDSRRYDLIIS